MTLLTSVNERWLESLCRQLLLGIGENPDRPELAETPRRWASWWKEFMDYEPGKVETAFESITSDQVVVVRGLRVWTICEHHLLPFYSDIAIGYIVREKMLGLSKLARIAQKHAHKLQVQERLVADIADEVSRLTESPDVAVLGVGVHLCMVSRGIKMPGEMVTSVVRGVFRDKEAARAEFLSLAR